MFSYAYAWTLGYKNQNNSTYTIWLCRVIVRKQNKTKALVFSITRYVPLFN